MTRTRSAVLGAGVLLACTTLLLAGCASDQTTEAETSGRQSTGEVPEGYDSWEDYWAAQDSMQRELEQEAQRVRMRRPRAGAGRP